MVLVGATLWGISGTVAQRLFQHDGFQPNWLVATRMTLSGLALLALAMFSGRSVFAIWQSRNQVWKLLAFSFAGILAVQYTYFASIASGNAATATFLQYLGPVFITPYLALQSRRWPRKVELLGVILAVLGTLLLVTNGHFTVLVVPPRAIVMGLLSAVALAFYTIYPRQLLVRWGSTVILGWAMFIGGAFLSLTAPVWQVSGQKWTVVSALFVAIVVIGGTLVPFYLYLASLKYISPTETSLLGGMEPLSAAVTAAVWLRVPFGVVTALGGFCIIATVTLLSLVPRLKRQPRFRHRVQQRN